MKKTLGELTTHLQNLCNSGLAEYEVGVKLLDGVYNAGTIENCIVSSDGKAKCIILIHAEAVSE